MLRGEGASKTPTHVVLPVQQVIQAGGNWCWAACVEMLLSYRGNPTTQFEIAAQYLNCRNCDQTPLPPSCDMTIKTLAISTILDHWGAKYQYAATAPSPAEIKQAIATDQSLLAGLKSHLTVVTGWAEKKGKFYLITADPRYDTGPIRFEFMVGTAYAWSHTWIIE